MIYKYKKPNEFITPKMRNFYKQRLFLDNLIIGEDCNQFTIQAHILVLCSFSERFSEAFINGEKIWKTDFFTTENKWTLDVIIDFMYYGSIDLSLDNVLHILRSAYFLKITDLVNCCVAFMKSNISEKFIKTWLNALENLFNLDSFGLECCIPKFIEGLRIIDELSELELNLVPQEQTIQEFYHETIVKNAISIAQIPNSLPDYDYLCTLMKSESSGEELNVLAYNISGLIKKIYNDDVLHFLFNYDIIILLQTFVKENERSLIGNLFHAYNCKFIPATEENIKPSGGIFFAIKSHLQLVNIETFNNKLVIRISHSQEDYYIVPLYINSSKDWKELDEFLSNTNGQNIMLLGDLNARIGNYQNSQQLLSEYCGILDPTRNSLDVNVNRSGQQLLEIIERHQLVVLNGNTYGDIRGESTCSIENCMDFCCAIKGEWCGNVHDLKKITKKFSEYLAVAATLKVSFSEEVELNVLYCSGPYVTKLYFEKFISEYDIIILCGEFLDLATKIIFENNQNYSQLSRNNILCAVKTVSLEFVKIEIINSKPIIKISHSDKNHYIVPLYLDDKKWNTEWKELVQFLSDVKVQNIMLLANFNEKVGKHESSENLVAQDSGVSATCRKLRDESINERKRLLSDMFEIHKFTNISNSNYFPECVLDYCLVKGKWSSMLNDFQVVYDVNFFHHHKPLSIKLNLP